MLIFLLQSVWLYISELAGKDLELDIILKFLINVSPRLVILVLPLTILLSSIMVFGSLSENYEFAAMKASGISLQRSMKSLIVFTFLLGIVTFFFSNNIDLKIQNSFDHLQCLTYRILKSRQLFDLSSEKKTLYLQNLFY